MNIRGHDSEHDSEQEPPSADLHAAEYVLGVLDADARRRAQGRIEAEPAFARLVHAWEQRFAALVAEIAPVTAPAHVWPRIRTRLGWSPIDGGRGGLLQTVGFWRGATAAALATAAVLAMVAVLRPVPLPEPLPPPTPIVTALEPAPPLAAAPVTTLTDDDGNAAYLASIDVRNQRVRVMPVPAAPDSEGRVPELWLIPEGEAPRSLGVIDTATAREIEIPDDLHRALAVGSLLAITLEPAGGAPQGVPTGPITAKGAIERI
ncbi:anti-sigma factor [Lysobacter sp. D1-1-M9]|uniref:anti-sigma factor n=1 Tax=Novilysobacter longmucuonensis TaxID=3098603 RepID=UPI002FC816EC